MVCALYALNNEKDGMYCVVVLHFALYCGYADVCILY